MSGETKKTHARQFQAPKGTRDFYPQDMAVRRYIESVWRTTSINHGFDEVEGPMFEYLDLYTHKSGPGIASELFQVFSGKDEAELAAVQRTAQAPFALRPEFTPTLARMVAAKADALPKPIKWFAIPSHFRAERPQRGRLREFLQWNVDFIGDESPKADAEVIATAIGALQKLRLDPSNLQLRINDRIAVQNELLASGLEESRLPEAFSLLDKAHKLSSSEFNQASQRIGLNPSVLQTFINRPLRKEVTEIWNNFTTNVLNISPDELRLHHLRDLQTELELLGLMEWCSFDSTIVRGLAYYTGTVFEIHESSGAERAIAGGGRYDNLIESFGGPKLPACGFGMGDVVLANVMHDKGLLPEEVYMEPLRPHAFVIAADENAASKLPGLVASLRKEGFHIRHSYKTTRNVGKLLGDAAKSRARFAIILGKELEEQRVAIKNMASGEQTEISLSEIANQLRSYDADAK